jgi:hypothetical protein
MKVRIKLIEEMLGTASANPELHREFIASKSADADKVKEEMESLPAEDLIEKSLTVFHRDTTGMPIIYDYQIKGFIKEATGALIEIADKEIKVGKTKLSKFTHKRIVDNYIFVAPRIIRLAPVSGVCTRPLRAETMRGERVALASSETVPAGTEFEIEIQTLSDTLVDLVKKCLDYGALKGIGQWRNSGKGRFVWKQVL